MVSTRSGRVVSAGQANDVAVPDVAPKKGTRITTKKATRTTTRLDREQEASLAEWHEDDKEPDEPQSEPVHVPFQNVSPVKVITPRTPKSAAKSDVSSPRATSAKPYVTPSKRQMQEVSQVPLPVEGPSSTAKSKSRRVLREESTGATLQQYLAFAFAGIVLASFAALTFLLLCEGTKPLPEGLVRVCKNSQPAFAHVLRVKAQADAEYARINGEVRKALAPHLAALRPHLAQLQARLIDPAADVLSGAWDLVNTQVSKLSAPTTAPTPTPAAPTPAPVKAPVRPPTPAFAHTISVESFVRLVAPGEAWAEAVHDVYQPAASATAVPKARAVVLTCTGTAECAEATEAVAAAAADASLVARVSGADLAESTEPAGELQMQLADFCKRAPGGVVVISGFRHLSLGAVTVLNNVLSEGGSLQSHGKAVPTCGALVVFVVQTDADPSSPEYTFQVKEQLHLAIASQAEDATDMVTAALARAFARRIDHVLPAAQ